MSEQRDLNKRQSTMWRVFDFAEGHGLEIGPLHNPVVPAAYADVSYLDVFDRDHLVANYGENPVVDVEKIPVIDYVLSDGDTVRSIPDAVGDDQRFDWVMASHVIEHVPDLVGWLDQIAQITVDGGALVLAVPDRRYTFDLHRPETTVGQILQAHDLRETAPSIRAVFDHRRSITSVRAPELWANGAVGYDRRLHSFEIVQEWMARARTGEYLDSHVWVFSPSSFLEQIIDLRDLDLAQWWVEKLVPTVRDGNEFQVVLRRLPRDGTRDPALLADEPRPGDMPGWLADELELRAGLDLGRTRLAEAEARLATTGEELARTRSELARAVSRADALSRREQSRVSYRLKGRVRRLPGFAGLNKVRRRARRAVRSLRRG